MPKYPRGIQEQLDELMAVSNELLDQARLFIRASRGAEAFGYLAELYVNIGQMQQLRPTLAEMYRHSVDEVSNLFAAKLVIPGGRGLNDLDEVDFDE